MSSLDKGKLVERQGRKATRSMVYKYTMIARLPTKQLIIADICQYNQLQFLYDFEGLGVFLLNKVNYSSKAGKHADFVE